MFQILRSLLKELNPHRSFFEKAQLDKGATEFHILSLTGHTEHEPLGGTPGVGKELLCKLI